MDLRESLETTQVTSLASTAALTASPDVSVREALQMLQERRKGCLLICEDDQLVGIFTERDLMVRVLGPGASLDEPIRKFMTPEPKTLALTDSVAGVVESMNQGGYRHLPVKNEAGEITGTISVKRIVRHLVEHFPAAVYNLPPVSLHMQQEREGA